MTLSAPKIPTRPIPVEGRKSGLRALLGRCFAERQILLRKDGVVRTRVISSRKQVALLALVVGSVAWVGFASANWIFKDEILAAREASLAQTEQEFEKLQRDFATMQSTYSAKTSALTVKQTRLQAVIDQRLALNNKEQDNESLTGDLKADKADGNVQPEISGTNKAVGGPALPIDSDESSADSSAQKATKEGEDHSLLNLFDYFGDAFGFRGRTYQGRDSDITARLETLDISQDREVDRLTHQIGSEVAGLEAAIKITGLNIDALLAHPDFNQPRNKSEQDDRPTGKGGPMIPLDRYTDLSGTQPAGNIESTTRLGAELDAILDDSALVELEIRMHRLAGLQTSLGVLPLTKPVGEYYVSSGFGRRTDPITKRRSHHAGVDMAGVKRSAINSTGAGRVVKAGRYGPYGKMIEIDHGWGLKTRYGHLHKIMVKRGDQIDLGQQIGQMGSTGRSTGPHVHYEILFNGKNRNPMKFFRAGNNILAGEQG